MAAAARSAGASVTVVARQPTALRGVLGPELGERFAQLGRHLRLDHWSNALNGGKSAASSLRGHDVTYDRVPYFFSDQYDLKQGS